MPTRTGADMLLDRPGRLDGERIGLVTNQTGVTADLEYVRVAMQSCGLDLRCLFSPEHGIWGIADAGESVDDTTDDLTGLPITSLYGDRRAPPTDRLVELDTLVFDVQDIGVRCWTYTTSMVECMRVAAQTDTQFVVLDRPNPLGGAPLSGAVMPAEWSSFVGLCGLPLLYGLTIGELATFVDAEHSIGADLTVIELEGWDRSSWYDETGLPWVPSIPPLSELRKALVYPTTVLLEGTNVTPGWGTGRGPMVAGAPWFNRERTIDVTRDRLASAGLSGVSLRPDRFVPREGVITNYPNEACTGVQIHVTDRDAYRPFRTGLVLLSAIHDVHAEFEWLSRDTELGERYWTDVLGGTDAYRTLISSGASTNALLEIADRGIDEYRSVRDPYLRY